MTLRRRHIPYLFSIVALIVTNGCNEEKVKPYGREVQLGLDAERGEVWAIAPAINLSGQREVDPLLQADIAYQQLQHVRGLTIIPVNRVAEVYATLRIERISSPEQASIVCDLLGADALVVPTVTAYDPYNPPKVGASLQMFRKSGSFSRPNAIDPRMLARAATPPPGESLPGAGDGGFIQAVGMFDSANGTVRDAVLAYAAGRNDPQGPMGAKEYFASMERYCGFVYYALIEDLLRQKPRT
jgi:hypothetical protein